ncbi:AAA family ATPase [Mesorhizobium sp. M0938]|uniref:AAA family ATPase n=1 Tax=unclassified Mesorhizobium TaxID=325217 RepID=UPI00333A2CE1
MKIERAVREKTFTLTSIAGPSGSGKTYSAILYARGLVGDAGKIGFIDTENKRSRFYADVGGGFDVIDMDPPFTSARYIEAINAFQDAGYTAIIIDSISHEWEGTGGVLEQAEAIEEATKRAGLHCWKKPKGAHKRLMNELLQTKAHLIFCCRVKEKVAQVKGANGKTEIVNQGFVVVQEKSFIYEMTVSMMLEEGTHVPFMQKCPDDLRGGFQEGKQVTVAAGNAVRMWSDKGTAVDPQFKADRLSGLNAANLGTKALADWWKGLSPSRQKTMEALKETFKSVAAARDLMAAELAEHEEKPLSERLSAAPGSPQDGEGFDTAHVLRETAALSGGAGDEQETTIQEPSENSPSSDVGSEEAPSPGQVAADPSEPVGGPAEAGEHEVADDQSTPPASDLITRNLMLECLDKFMALAVDANVPDAKQRRANIEFAKNAWKEALPQKLDFVKSCFESADKLVRGELQADAARKYLEGLL